MTEKCKPHTKAEESRVLLCDGLDLTACLVFAFPRERRAVVCLGTCQNSRPFCIGGTMMVISSPSLAREAGHQQPEERGGADYIWR